jgi:hypothetical protein
VSGRLTFTHLVPVSVKSCGQRCKSSKSGLSIVKGLIYLILGLIMLVLGHINRYSKIVGYLLLVYQIIHFNR